MSVAAIPQRLRGALFPIALLLVSSAWGEAGSDIAAAAGRGTTLPGTSISVASAEEGELLSAEVSSTLATPFEIAVPALASAESWCQFMPLHFNIKACTFETRQGQQQLTLYSGRKSYQTPDESQSLTYHFAVAAQDADHLSLLLSAARGPAGTRDYRIRVEARRVAAGTQLQIYSAYRPSLTSSLLTRSYLATLGRDKVGFSRVTEGNESHLVQGVRGVIERNVMRYQLAIDSYLKTHTLPQAARHEAALKGWFVQNEHYPQQLHEMGLEEYLGIKRREWQNQQRMQQALNERMQVAAR